MELKEIYDEIRIEVISFENEDVIVTSNWGPEQG